MKKNNIPTATTKYFADSKAKMIVAVYTSMIAVLGQSLCTCTEKNGNKSYYTTFIFSIPIYFLNLNPSVIPCIHELPARSYKLLPLKVNFSP